MFKYNTDFFYMFLLVLQPNQFVEMKVQ